MPHRVTLRNDRKQLLGPRLRRFKRKPHDSFDTHAREDCDLCRCFPGVVDVRAAALAGVLAFGVLADEHPVDLLGCVEFAFCAGEGAHGADVGVELEGAAEGEQQAPEGDVVWDVGVAYGAEEGC